VLLLDVTPLSLGIETMGGVMTKMIEKNTTIPTKTSRFFAHRRTTIAVTVHAAGRARNGPLQQALAKFNLEGIAGPAWLPQIVSFDIDANGILHVSAKDKKTGKEHKITIKAGSGLSEEEIARWSPTRKPTRRRQEVPGAGAGPQPGRRPGPRHPQRHHRARQQGRRRREGKVEAALADLEDRDEG
jgi:molecular chaperone DnaK